ncbi:MULTISPECIES: competence type IV pilus minor pilin ComGE [Enterococcus]|uniref:competence type IV pilus minor pilin ComGE n=1 Tax=Enterococcus TaxID=1350 RepID=UPI0020CEB3D0|nr:competence type IV pilus minor pilin ComGE [Enterococcus sp. 3H8_DIV0648]
MDVLKENKGYILLESLISLAILVVIVSSYIEVTVELQKESRQRLSELSNYRDLYNETRRCRLHSASSTKSQIEIILEQGLASNRQGGILIVKK